MDFSLSDDQQGLRDEIIRFAVNELNEATIHRDHEGIFPEREWKKCASFGIQGLAIPKEYGGSGFDPLTTMIAMEALGYGCTDNGLIFSLNAQMWSCEAPIVRFGDAEQKGRYLPGLSDGSLIGVQAMSEPGAGSDAFGMSTNAQAVDGGHVLTGTKTFITNAPIADIFVIFARTAPELGFAGISAFLVERGSSGLSVGQPFHKMGLRTSPMAEVILDGCVVPDGNLLGSLGSGMAIFNHSMAWERSCILASAIGTMQRQVERCVAYAQERRQFGQPIGLGRARSRSSRTW